MNRNKLLTLLIGVCLALALVAVPFMSACAPEEEEEEEEEEIVEEVKWVTIGHIQPMTGPAGYWGVGHDQGILIAIDEINEAGGFLVNGQRYMLKLETFDSRYDSKLCVTGLTKLVEKGIKLIIGPMAPAGVIAAGDVTWEHRALMVGAQAVVALKMENSDLPNYFQVETNEERCGFFASLVVEGLGAKTIGGMVENSDFFVELEEYFFPALEEAGCDVLITERHDPALEDFYTIIAKIKEADPDVVLPASCSYAIALFLKQRMELNYPVQCITGDGMGHAGASMFRISGAAAAEGLIEHVWFFDSGHEFADWELDTMGIDLAELEKFTQASLEKYGLDWFAGTQGWGYVFTKVLVDTMQRAGTVTDGEALIAALETIDLRTAIFRYRFAPGSHSAIIPRIWVRRHVTDEATGEFTSESIGGSKPLDPYGREWETFMHIELNIDDIRAGIVPGTSAYGIGY